MGLVDYNGYLRTYADHGPPMRLVLALYAGWEPPVKASTDVLTDQDLINFLSAFPGGEAVPGGAHG